MKPFYSGITAGLLTILLNTGAGVQGAINPANTFMVKSEIQSLESLIIDSSQKLREQSKKSGLKSHEIFQFYLDANELFKIYLSNPTNKDKVKNNELFWREYGEVLLETRQINQALQIAKNLVLNHPNNPDNYSLLGRAYAEKNEDENAIECYQKAITRGIDNPEKLITHYAHSLAKLGRIDEASALIDKQIQSTPDFYKLYFLKGWLYEQKGKIDEAIAEYEKSTKIFDKDANVWMFLGDLLEQKKDYAHAKQCFKQVLELAPDQKYYQDKLRNTESSQN